MLGITLLALTIYAQIKPLVAIYVMHEPRPERYPELVHDMILVMIFVTPLQSLFEELVGRVLTTAVAKWIAGTHRFVILPLIITSSVIFSILHTLGSMGVLMALFTYLPLGIALHIVYLKCGGWRGGWGILVGLACCWALHFFYNCISYTSTLYYAQ